MKFNSFCYFSIFCLLTVLSCTSKSGKETSSGEQTSNRVVNPDFEKVDGVRFFETKRRFKNGLSFNKDGFQHEPTWIIEFKAPDTMLAYSPEKNDMEHFFLQHDHGQVYNFAREFFRAIKVTKDSMVLQRLQVDGKIIAGDDDVRSDVFCTFYTRNYIEKTLKTTIGELQKPTKRDTIYIESLAAQTLKDPANPELAFAAKDPVKIDPKSKYVTSEKISTIDATNHRTASYDYMYPQYNLAILRAYKDFNYSFSVIVDAQGKMYVNRVDGVLPADMPSRKKLLQGITDVYLKNLFKITPGTTLGIPHSSEVTIYLKGKLAK